MYFFNFEDFQIIGASPEILVRLRDGQQLLDLLLAQDLGVVSKQDIFMKKIIER